MVNFKTNDRVKWIKKMACVPHPDGKTDSEGNIFPVFRDTTISGRIISNGVDGGWVVRPDSAESYKDKICGERYYDVYISGTELTLIN